MGDDALRSRWATAVAATLVLLLTAAFVTATMSLTGADADPPAIIGWARQEPDGTLTLFLDAYTAGGDVGHGAARYRPDDPDYADVAAHVGPIPRGGSVPVRPWPDD